MVKNGPAKKLTIYVNETDRVRGKPVYEVLLDLFYRRKLSGASVFRGIEGYGSDGVFHTAKILELSTSLPVKVEVVESADLIAAVIPEVQAIVTRGLIEVSDTTVIQCCMRETA